MDRKILSNIDLSKVVHPDDEAVISRLNEMSGFKTFLKNTVERFTVSWTDITYTGNGYGITEVSSPELYNRIAEDCKVLGVETVPKVSALWGYFISSNSVGESNYRILVTSGAVDLLTPEEFDFLVGHELGHLLCGHMPYKMLMEALYSPFIKTIPGSEYVSVARFPLLKWHRFSHYTADRVGLLCCQDINVALKAMIKMAGLPRKYFDKVNVQEFVKQSDEFADSYSGKMDALMKSVMLKTSEAPWMVLRAKKLMEWYEGGTYEEVVSHA